MRMDSDHQLSRPSLAATAPDSVEALYLQFPALEVSHSQMMVHQ